MLVAIVLGPLIILSSVVVDLVVLPGQIMKDSSEFERKYSFSSAVLS